MLDRIFAIILVLVAAVLPVKYMTYVLIPEVQLILGTLVVLYILIGDAFAGCILGIAVLVMYFRSYSAKMGITWKTFFYPNRTYTNPLVSDYITPDHLERIQTNVADPENYLLEMKGIEGVYGEDVYGAQGMNQELPGYSKPTSGIDLESMN